VEILVSEEGFFSLELPINWKVLCIQYIVVVGGMECGGLRKGRTQLRFGILYMNVEVGLGLF